MDHDTELGELDYQRGIAQDSDRIRPVCLWSATDGAADFGRTRSDLRKNLWPWFRRLRT